MNADILRIPVEERIPGEPLFWYETEVAEALSKIDEEERSVLSDDSINPGSLVGRLYCETLGEVDRILARMNELQLDGSPRPWCLLSSSDQSALFSLSDKLGCLKRISDTFLSTVEELGPQEAANLARKQSGSKVLQKYPASSPAARNARLFNGRVARYLRVDYSTRSNSHK